MRTNHGSGQLAFSAISYCAQGTIYLMQGDSRLALDPAELRAMLADHDPEDFYDDYPVAQREVDA